MWPSSNHNVKEVKTDKDPLRLGQGRVVNHTKLSVMRKVWSSSESKSQYVFPKPDQVVYSFKCNQVVVVPKPNKSATVSLG